MSSRWIKDWNPEDEAFWQVVGRPVARRNLVWSVFAEHVGFSVWMMWSVIAPQLPKLGFAYRPEQLFTLVAVPALVGALVRLPYTFAVPRFGGRNWTIVSVLLLLLPVATVVALVNRPDTPFALMLAASASAGLGGGNFASSMANISFFYPDKTKGLALGLNAAGGNLGISTVQLFAPMVIGIGADAASRPHLQNIGLMWLPLILVAAIGAWFFMNNLAGTRSSLSDQVAVVANRHTWIVSMLYIATFGSFVGFSAALPLLLKTQFPTIGTNLVFAGALIGAVARPIGGKLSDRLGGARVTFWNFILMGLAASGVVHFLGRKEMGGFLAMFGVLFLTTGLGNGSTFRMIPLIFRAQRRRTALGQGAEARAQAQRMARRDSAAVIGICSAVGALGGFFIPTSLAASIKATGGPSAALTGCIGFYLICTATTWWCYMRHPARRKAKESAAVAAPVDSDLELTGGAKI